MSEEVTTEQKPEWQEEPAELILAGKNLFREGTESVNELEKNGAWSSREMEQ